MFFVLVEFWYELVCFLLLLARNPSAKSVFDIVLNWLLAWEMLLSLSSESNWFSLHKLDFLKNIDGVCISYSVYITDTALLAPIKFGCVPKSYRREWSLYTCYGHTDSFAALWHGSTVWHLYVVLLVSSVLAYLRYYILLSLKCELWGEFCFLRPLACSC